MKFQGQIPNRNKEFYTTFLLPVALLKKALESVRRYIDRTIWSELIQGEKVDNEILNLVLFALFCLISLITFRLEKYQSTAIVFLGCLWYVDRFLARWQYLSKKGRSVTSLAFSKDDIVTWKMVSPTQETRQMRFHRNNLEQIVIKAIRVNGGAFEANLARAWQVAIALIDGTNLLMYEELRVIDAFDCAQKLAAHFDIPIIFQESEGKTRYADRATEQAPNCLNRSHSKSISNDAIRLNQTAQRWHIYSHWTLARSWKFFGKVFHESGFLLFVLLLTRFMSRFGEMLDTLIAYYSVGEGIYLDFSGIINFFFSPNLSWIDLVGIAIATATMIGRGAQISQVKHIYINRQKLKFAINAKEICQFDLQDIEVVLMIAKPEPVLLICNCDRALEVRDLLQEDDYRVVLSNIENGIAHFQ
jgi:hypothetical protein